MESRVFICVEDALIALDVFEAITMSFPELAVMRDVRLMDIDQIVARAVGPICVITQTEGAARMFQAPLPMMSSHIHLGGHVPPTATHHVAMPFTSETLVDAVKAALSRWRQI